MITLSVPNCFREAMQFLRERGIEPEISGTDLRFKKPRGKKGEQLMDELYSRYKSARPACQTCEGTADVYLIRCTCGAVGAFCGQCLKAGRFEPHQH